MRVKTFVGDEGMSEPEGRVTLTPKSLRATRFDYQFRGLVNGTIVSACNIILRIFRQPFLPEGAHHDDA